jgi:nucleotide-binding universal stress UspA family protein
MKEIIVGVDFSEGSLNALKYAIHLAQRFDFNVTMIYVDKPYNPLSVYKEDEEHRKEIHTRFEEILKENAPTLGERLKYKIRTGKVYEEIAMYAKANNAALIIVGTHGISGYEELWIGSNANRIVSIAPCPVITIRQNFPVSGGPTRILLPIDRTPDTTLKVPVVLPFAKAFDAHIVLLKLFLTNLPTLKKRVNTTAEKVIEEIKKMKLSYTVREKIIMNLTSDLLNVIEEEKCDLIAISTEQYNQEVLTILGEAAQQVVNVSPIPVLSVHPNDKPFI